MTRDDISRMAREAGMHDPMIFLGAYERFAKLVADAAAAAERDAIARMFEASPELVPSAKNDHGGCILCGFDPKMAASAIRARGNT